MSRSIAQLADLRRRLQLSETPRQTLPGRELELSLLLHALRAAIEGQRGKTLYISGETGTGKTAVVRNVLQQLQGEYGSDHLRYCFINAMKLSSPREAFNALWSVCSQYHVSAESQRTRAVKSRIPAYLSDMFSSASGARDRPYIIVVIDELDFLVSSKQQEIYEFFNWPQYEHSRLCVIGVANTINLLDDLLPKISSRVEITERITFQTYTFQQILSILRDRIGDEGEAMFEKSALELCARKIGVTFGDIRKGLSICRRAIEIVEDELEEEMLERQSRGDREGPIDQSCVQSRHVDLAFQELYSTIQSYPLTRLPLYHKIFLVCAIREQQYLGRRELSFEKIVHRVQNAVQHQFPHLPYLRINDILPMVEMLASLHVLSIKHTSTERFRNIEINAETDLMEQGFREDTSLAPLFTDRSVK